MADVHDRLYATQTGFTKAEKQALANSWRQPDPVSVARLQKMNKDAVIQKVEGHGLTVVTYPPGRMECKQAAGGNSFDKRNALGGFFAS